jgi:hypothetical protein
MNEIQHPELSIDRCAISWDPTVPCVVFRWLGYVTSPEFRALSERGLELLRSKGASRMLNDTTHLPIIGEDDQRWVNQVFIPRALATGFRICAMVNSRFYFNRVAVENVARQISPGELVIEYFEGSDSAKEWLRQAPA